MNFKSNLVKMAIKLTPNFMVLLAANFILKGIVEISDFIFDLDSRTVFVRATLVGENEPIEVSINDFSIISHDGSHQFFIDEAQSNRLWLNNIFAHIVGKKWSIPQQPQYKEQIELVAELFKEKVSEQAD